MERNARKPMFVFVGAWNPAIFQPGWIAGNLFEIPEGKEVSVTTVLMAEPDPTFAHFIDDIGVGVNGQRLFIYCNADSETAFDRAERVAELTFSTLPHTPRGPYGVNFEFVERSPKTDLVQRLSPKDGLEREYVIVQQRLMSSISLQSPPCTLNLTRHVTPAAVTFDFNFHFPDAPTAGVRGVARGVLDRAISILDDVYGLRDFTFQPLTPESTTVEQQP